MSQLNKRITLVLETVATRSYPFAQETLDQLQDLRKLREDDLKEETGNEYLVPAPVIIAEAVNLLHTQTFGKE